MKFFEEIISCAPQEKKLRITLLFFWIAFVIIVILLDLIEKVMD